MHLYLDLIILESQRNRTQHQKAAGTQKHVCVLHTFNKFSVLDYGSSNPHPVQTTPEKIKWKEHFPLRIGPPSNLCPSNQKRNPANISFKAAVAMLFSLKRQDVLFWSRRQGDHIASPHKHCRQVSLRPWVSLPATTLIPQRVVGMEGYLPLASSKMPSRQWVFSEPAKILEPLSGGAGTPGAPSGAQGPRVSALILLLLEIMDLQRFIF